MSFIRDFLNAVLAFIGAASLTDEEFDSLTIESYGYDSATYEALLAVLDSREALSNDRTRLQYFFLAKGVEVSAPAGSSNIFVGSVLCD